jgi:membrane protein DedA with SNARE-associated domain
VVLASISGSVTHQVAAHGVYAVFVLMAVDAVFPAASELVMLYAGAIAAGAFSTTISLFGASIGHGAGAYLVLALSGTLGYLLGGVIGWWIGRRGGRPLVERHGRLLHLDPARFARAEQWFERWGALGVLVGRITPLVRSFVSIPAGVLEMALVPYALLTLVGSAVWAFALAGAGWALGSRYAGFDHGFHYAEYAVVALVVVAAAALALRLVRAAR